MYILADEFADVTIVQVYSSARFGLKNALVSPGKSHVGSELECMNSTLYIGANKWQTGRP